jgi:hypothetical protein
MELFTLSVLGCVHFRCFDTGHVQGRKDTRHIGDGRRRGPTRFGCVQCPGERPLSSMRFEGCKEHCGGDEGHWSQAG